ncbi:AraC family transcriptional regulator [Bosea caraganae]|uniref:AraC family transcriptional regulator n=1 Tax=Bosea caraganae TaxID=2763117 RepID=A0A370L9F7_9HYPH|nr:AraC family transcriptional regulator [Bosea caraganae]RDJ22030.1 AraC family transcriptional regulator [Bosea caraganae]RDJ27937.1 AraC family transcriptional regulator [Bosea caraganae]
MTTTLPCDDDEVAAGMRKLGAMIARHVGDSTGGATPVPGLAVARLASAGVATSYLYEPSLCMIAQGAKRVALGETTYRYDEKRFLLTAVGLPTVVQIERASEEAPYTSFQLYLDLDVARQLIADMDLVGHEPAPAEAGMITGPVTEDLLDPILRLIGLLSRPGEIPILAAGIHREILYRLLISPAGERLRQIVRLGTQSNRSARAIGWLRQNFARRLRIEDLAEETGMAVSTLHHHFKAVTNMSPLQFQKHLRLHEARRLMLTEELDAGVAALKVGYESVTQFNREYRRLFGAPPRRDIQALLAAGVAPARSVADGDRLRV